LHQDVQAFFNSQGGIKDDKAKAERQDIVACADFEEIADCTLGEENNSSACGYQDCK
jgi:hypothetical protein